MLKQDSAPCYYLYRLIMGDHQQIGLVAAASVADYDTNRIRKHEFTRPDKEDDRVRQVDALNAQTGPVFLTYKHNAAIDELAAKVTAAAPEIDIVADTGVRHSLWVVSRRGGASISSPAPSTPWIASTSRTATTAPPPPRAWPRRARPPTRATPGKRPTTISCAVIFPDNQMQILDYNRVLKDLNGNSPEQFLAKLEGAFTVEKVAGQCKPGKAGEFGMYLGGQWYRLTIKPELIPQDPVKRLDVSLLAGQPHRPDSRHRRSAARQTHRFRGRHPGPKRAGAARGLAARWRWPSRSTPPPWRS